MQTAKIKTKAEKELLIQEFLASGKSKTIWCQEKGIPYPTFHRWFKRYELNHETSQTKFIALSKESSTKELAEKNSNQASNLDSSFMIVEVNDCKINITNTFDCDFLTRLIKAVKLANV